MRIENNSEFAYTTLLYVEKYILSVKKFKVMKYKHENVSRIKFPDEYFQKLLKQKNNEPKRNRKSLNGNSFNETTLGRVSF